LIYLQQKHKQLADYGGEGYEVNGELSMVSGELVK
jgi:hypothetical protein